MVKPAAQHRVVAYLEDHYSLSQRRACRLVHLHRSSARYVPCRPDDEKVREKLHELAGSHPRFGYPRLHVLLHRERYMINHRLLLVPTGGNERRSIDFMSDELIDGQRFRLLTVVDVFYVGL